jgi:hypothetical protein
MNVVPFDDSIVWACTQDAQRPARVSSLNGSHPANDGDKPWTAFGQEAVHFPSGAI